MEANSPPSLQEPMLQTPCKNVITALKNQLLLAKDNIYIRALKDHHISYMNQTIRAILNHLLENYGIITPLELKDNDTKMRSN